MNLKCRKCRFLLPLDENLLNLNENVCCSSFQQIFSVLVDETIPLPGWLMNYVDEGDWCKGKIFCPKCQSKLGGFDFISGTKCRCAQRKILPEVHLNKCKIDLDLGEIQIQTNDRSDKKKLFDKIRQENWPIVKESQKNIVSDDFLKKSHRKTNSWHSTTLGGTLNNILGTFILRRSKSTPKISSLPEIFETKSKKSSEAEINQDKLLRNSKSSNVAISVPDYLICCICLEIFVLPRSCLPCAHTFCEPCLRLLSDAHQRSTSTLSRLKILCPLCRRLIQFTEPDQEILKIVRTQFPNDYQLRLNWYKRQHALRRYPLPGFESWSYVHKLFRRLPDAVSRRITSNFSPIWTVYSFCLSFLCVIFFFVCFVPAVYVSTYVYNYVENLSFFAQTDVGDDTNSTWFDFLSSEIGDFFVFILNGGAVSATISIMITTSVALYLVFLL